MIFCAPTYKQVLKREPCKVVQYRKWEPENISQLRACLECTDWTELIENSADINVNMDIFNSPLDNKGLEQLVLYAGDE